MGRYLARRLLLLVPTLLGVSVIVFLFIRLIPGDPATAILRESATAAQVAELNAKLGFDRPLPVQYLEYMGRIVRGDLGESFHTRLTVVDQLKQKLPATMELALSAMIIATVAGVLLGILAAMRRGSILDYGTMTLALVGVSMPIFWLGLMLIYAFAVNLHWLPPSTRGEPPELVRTGLYTLDYLAALDANGFLDTLRHLALPGFVLATVPLAVIARQTRSAMLEVLGQDFVRTARSKGLRQQTVIARHVLKNAMLPVITVVGLQTGALLSGAVLTETVFSWPGMGTYVLEAILARDYTVVQSVVLVFAFIFVMVNLIVDLSYAWLDPRIKYA
ncbi:MAG: ABC transporter permease [Chloroflexi bacterium]|nr:ABC transporter permease [Chloroflexota bacterium]